MEITKELTAQVDYWIAEHKAQFVDEICQLVRYPSIADSGSAVKPFGQPCRDVLDAYLEIGKKHGFAMRNHNYYVGEAYVPEWEDKPRRIGLLGHLDVVPVGEGWIYPPFEGIVKDGLIIGRGSQDNKGPCLAALYTVMCLRDLGVPLEYDVCALAGTDEESGMGDILYYRDHASLPDLILVTDSGFPICYGERPVVGGKMTANRPFSKIRSFYSVNVPGLVPRHAEAVLEKSEELLARLQALPEIPEGCGWRETEDGILCWADSVTGHPSFTSARSGVIVRLLRFLLDCDLVEDAGDKKALWFGAEVACSPDGAALSIDFADEESGKMSFGCSTMQLEDGKLQLGFSARCPITIDPDKVVCGFGKELRRDRFYGCPDSLPRRKLFSEGYPGYYNLE